MNNVALNFKGPYGLTNDNDKVLFQEAISKQCGIYLWATPYKNGGLIINYIGETSISFWQRSKDHMIQTMGGNYRICDPDGLLKGIEKILWNGLWRRGTRDKIEEYLDHFIELAPAIQKTFRILKIFVAPLSLEKRIQQRVEGALAIYIKEQPPPASSLLPKDIRYYYRKKEEAPISVSINCSVNIHGLPKQLIA